MTKIRICKHEGCKNAGVAKGYCRLHYLRNWRRIREIERKDAAKKLNDYIENICKKHPTRYLEIIKEDIREHRADEAENIFEKMPTESRIFGEPTCDEEIENLIRELKIEKGF